MTDTVVSDAAKFPQDEGYPNIADGNETWTSAGHLGLLATATANGPFIYDGFTFSSHDATNDTVTVDPGIAVLDLSDTGPVDVQSTVGGSSAPSYDTTLSKPGAIVVEAPTATTVDVVDTQTNPVWVAYATDGTVSGVAAGDVYLRHENGGGVSAPPHPSVKIGEANPDDATQDYRAGYDNPPDALGWRVDPNSPYEDLSTNPDGAQVDINLAGRYDEVRIEGTVWTDRAQNTGFDVRIENDATQNYQTWFSGSDNRSGMTDWNTACRVTSSGADETGTVSGSFKFTISGRWNGTSPQPTIENNFSAMQSQGGGISPFDSGEHSGSLASPLTQINLIPTNDMGYAITVRGRHTGQPGVQ